MPEGLSTLLTQASAFLAFTQLDCLGCFASGCVLLTFCMQSMVRLRLIALLSNIAFIAYGWAGRLMPILVLHCMLFLINSANLARARSARRATRRGIRFDKRSRQRRAGHSVGHRRSSLKVRHLERPRSVAQLQPLMLGREPGMRWSANAVTELAGF